jgi:hypothetical protein
MIVRARGAALREDVLPDIWPRRFGHLLRYWSHDDFRRLRNNRGEYDRLCNVLFNNWRCWSFARRQDARRGFLVWNRQAMEIGAKPHRPRRRAKVSLRNIKQADENRADDTKIREKRHVNSRHITLTYVGVGGSRVNVLNPLCRQFFCLILDSALPCFVLARLASRA